MNGQKSTSLLINIYDWFVDSKNLIYSDNFITIFSKNANSRKIRKKPFPPML